MTLTRPRIPLVSCVSLAASIIVITVPAAGAEKPLPANSIGYDDEVRAGAPPAAAEPGAAPGAEASDLPPLVVRLGVAWSTIESEEGVYRWEGLDAAVSAAEAAAREIVLNLHGGNPLYLPAGTPLAPSEKAAMAAWEAFVRASASRYASRVRIYQIGRFPDRDGRPAAEAARGYAFLFKRSAVVVQGADPGSQVALATIDAGSTEFASVLLAEEVAPYADAVAAAFEPGEDGQEALARLSALILTHDPSARLWITGVRLLLGPAGYAGMLRAYVAGLDREAALVTFEDPPDARGRPFHLAAMERARALFTPGFGPLVESGRGVRALTPAGSDLPGARAARFFDPETKTVLMAYDGGPETRRGEFGVFVVDTTDLADPVLHDVTSGETSSSVAIQKDPNMGVSRLALPLAEYPIILAYRRFTEPGYAAEGENVAVTGERVPTAEEIIAHHQAAQAAQDALLRSVRADAEETWHFSIGTGDSYDVTFQEAFYLDPNVGAEWEQKAILVNGVRWKLKTIPELPFIMPEKVVSLPLRITLTKDYTYTYEGREAVDGHDCHVVSFDPIDKDRNLARGRVWFDSGTFARVRLAMVQSNLDPPVVSNDQRDTYAPVTGPDGYAYWVLSRIESQQIYSTAGRNFVINKDVRLSGFVINGPDFGEHRQQALASPHQILRDTDKGLRYLARTGDGGRVVKEGVTHRNVFVLGGALYNESLDYPVPLAGINYFDSDLFGLGLQTNVLFAGLLVFANLSDPSLLGTRMDASVDLTGLAFAPTDRLVREAPATNDIDEKEEEAVTFKEQSLTMGVGLPFWKFFKVRGEGQVAYDDYGRTEDTCEAFVTPRDTYVRTGTVIGEFNRKAWVVSLQRSWSERQRHEPWGLDASTDPKCPTPGGGAFPPDFFEAARHYVRYAGTVGKEFYLPFGQKIRLRVSGLGGGDQDRFSKYRFGLFDNRLRGFSGSAVHFTNGAVAHLEYAFNLGDVVRFEAIVDQARVKDRQLGEDFRDYTGFGLAGQFVGPWGLLFRLDWGIAVASDVPEFEGEQEVQLTVLKLFSQR